MLAQSYIHQVATSQPARVLIASLASLPSPSHHLVPQLAHARPSDGEHAVLQTVECAAVYGRHELARDQAQENAERQIVRPQPVAKLSVLVEQGTKRKRDRLILSANDAASRPQGVYLEPYV